MDCAKIALPIHVNIAMGEHVNPISVVKGKSSKLTAHVLTVLKATRKLMIRHVPIKSYQSYQ